MKSSRASGTLPHCPYNIYVSYELVFGAERVRLDSGGSSLVGILVCGGCGVLFIFLGNYMPRIKQNYMFGCKTPWALNNEHNWNRTQRMGGIVFVVMGAALIVISLLATILGDAATMILLLPDAPIDDDIAHDLLEAKLRGSMVVDIRTFTSTWCSACPFRRSTTNGCCRPRAFP